MHSKRASAQKKVRGRKDVAPEMKPAEREGKGQGRGSAEQSRVDGSRTVYQENLNRCPCKSKYKTNNRKPFVRGNKLIFILKMENHWSVLNEWHVCICIKISGL